MRRKAEDAAAFTIQTAFRRYTKAKRATAEAKRLSDELVSGYNSIYATEKLEAANSVTAAYEELAMARNTLSAELEAAAQAAKNVTIVETMLAVAACIRVQSVWRGFQQRKAYKFKIKSIIQVQAMARGYIARKREAERQISLLEAEAAAAEIAAAIRAAKYDKIYMNELEETVHAVEMARTELATFERSVIDNDVDVRVATNTKSITPANVTDFALSPNFEKVSSNENNRIATECTLEVNETPTTFMTNEAVLVSGPQDAIQTSSDTIIKENVEATRVAVEAKNAISVAEKSEAALVIQHWYRGRFLRHSFIIKRRAAVIIQRAVRLGLNVLRITRRTAAATKIQTAFRGFVTRKKACRKLLSVRARLAAVNATASESMTLGNRTTSALEILLTHKQLSFVLRACENLEIATKLSTRCSERMVENNAVPIMFQLIRLAPHVFFSRPVTFRSKVYACIVPMSACI